jgi:hypothetical protein
MRPAPIHGMVQAHPSEPVRQHLEGVFPDGVTETIERRSGAGNSRKNDPRTGKRRNLGTFRTRTAAERHERAVQFFKRH